MTFDAIASPTTAIAPNRVTQKYPYGRLYNLYLDPKETYSYLIRKLAYLEAFQGGVRNHLRSFRDHPPKLLVGLNV